MNLCSYILLYLKVWMYKLFKLPFSLIFMEIDHFNVILFTHGKKIAKCVSKDIKEIILHNIPQNATLFPYNIEKFLILLEGVEEAEAYKWAESIRKVVRAYPFYTMSAHMDRVTLSGVVTGTLELKKIKHFLKKLKHTTTDTVIQIQ